MPLLLTLASFDSTSQAQECGVFSAGFGTTNPNMPLVLASASFDTPSQAQECGEV